MACSVPESDIFEDSVNSNRDTSGMRGLIRSQEPDVYILPFIYDLTNVSGK